jgi:hypothetical protein
MIPFISPKALPLGWDMKGFQPFPNLLFGEGSSPMPSKRRLSSSSKLSF